jgi:hypothetical protein
VAQFLALGDLNADGNGRCLGAFHDANNATNCSTGFATNGSLPSDDSIIVPASGATVTSLQARVRSAPAAGQSYLVTVLNNGSPIMTCTVAATTNTCGPPSVSSAAAAAGTFLQVKITESLGNPPANGWFVSFRY